MNLPVHTVAASVVQDGAAGVKDTVLLVDDDPVMRMLTAAALVERGWRVVEADGGGVALERFAAERPQVVVLDALMPEPDGFATCERIRRLPGGQHVPILMLTGLDDESSVARAYEAGSTDFFVKSSGQWMLLSERLRYLLRAAHTREELLASQEKLSKAQRIARLGSWEWDFRLRSIRVSDEFRAVAGFAQEDRAPSIWGVWSRIAPEDRGRVASLLRDGLRRRALMTFECGLVCTDGSGKIARVEAEFEYDATGRATGLHGVIQDVTERRQAEDQIRRLANYDGLTGLPNRRFLVEEFGATLARAKAEEVPLALLFVDVDRFKQINDTLGHDVGDQVLREVAWRLHSTIRETDTVARVASRGARRARSDSVRPEAPPDSRVARLGGDEFTVLLTNLFCADDIDRVMRRLIDAIRVPIDCFGHTVHVTTSIGIAMFPRDGDDVDSLLRKADMAMYEVKKRGGGSWLAFEESMNTAVKTRWSLEAGLRRALERDELVLHYQPKIEVATGAVVGAEALLRWRRDGELVAPAEFIRAAEDSNLIVPITEWALAEACRQMRVWVPEWDRRQMGAVPVAVNISSILLQRGNLVGLVRAALEHNGVPRSQLEIEITETVLMRDLKVAKDLLQEFRELGVPIAIDDFGTGYSSLAYLRRLPIDTIKIDRSFVAELETDDDAAAIVAAIIAMTQALKLQLVAEGVETPGQRDLLAQQGCRIVQGFLYAPPLSADRFLQWVDGTGTARALAPRTDGRPRDRTFPDAIPPARA